MNEYAVNLADLTRFAHASLNPVMLLLRPVLAEAWVTAEPKRLDGAAVLFSCDEERSRAIVSVIRMRVPKHQLRLYVREAGRKNWVRV